MDVGRDEVVEVARRDEGIERVHDCFAGRFRRPEPRRRALDYLLGQGVASFKNIWALSELGVVRMTLIFDTVVRA